VTAYDWPAVGRPTREDDSAGRRAWNAGRGALRGGSFEAAFGGIHAELAPNAAADLWAPVGPVAVLGSNETGTPRVTGRVADIWVEPVAGQRAYAASATGGIWFTGDAGGSWRSLGGWRSADPKADSVASSPFANGCLLVTFANNADPTDGTGDDVWVGTGEMPLLVRGLPGEKLPGIGVLHAVGPSTQGETATVFTAEATNLVGRSIARLAQQPGGTGFVAATSIGLVERGSGGGPQATWDAVSGLPTGDKDKALVCTDVLWTPPAGAQQGRLWAALVRPGTNNMELWWRADGSNDFVQLALPPGAGAAAPQRRLVLAASPSGDTIWVLGDGPRLWRIDPSVATPTAVPVAGVPPLWGAAGSFTASKMALTVDPSNPANLALGGTTSAVDAGLVIGTVTGPPAGPLAFTAAGSARGQGVHPDILNIRFTKDGKQVWVACDGGVFVSTQSGANGTFVARNGGMAVVEAGFVACHPTNDVALVLGAQDNATMRRSGEALWSWEQGGDGGGVAFDQVTTHRYVAQYTNADWSNGPNPPRAPVHRGAKALWQGEENRAGFYSSPATIANGANNQLAIGTNRVWFTTDWGAHWVTLPNGVVDPRPPGGPINNAQDALPAASGPIRALRWATVDRLWVMCRRALHQMQRNAGVWSRSDVSLEDVFHPAKTTDVVSTDTCNDIAVHDPTKGARGSLYLALEGDISTGKDDQLWWYDGDGSWHKTGLADTTSSAALAVLVEPAHPEVVYVGTGIGVFRSTLSFDGNDPKWSAWTRLDNGLPDVAVQDLALFSNGPIRLLRAATQARGVWELDLSGPVADRTYVRVHAYDSRRTLPASLVAPFEPKIHDPANAANLIDTTFRWHASPDLKVHPKLGPMAAPTTLPWTQAKITAGVTDRTAFWKLWRFQAALRHVDIRAKATGVWDADFDAVLRANGVPIVGGAAQITKAYWESIVTGANLIRTPWDTKDPTEADLVEYLPAETNIYADREPGGTVPRSVLTAYVVIHHRGASPAAAGDIQATLLWRAVPKWQAMASTAWATENVSWAASVTSLLTDGTPPAALGQWHLADTASQRHGPGASAIAGSPAVVTFDVDLSTVANGSLVLLAAVVHSANDHVTINEAPIDQLTRSSPHVAVRSVVVRT
jgi:hypothetical protein